MRIQHLLIALCSLGFGISPAFGQSESSTSLATKTDSVSYALGMDIARSLKSGDFEIDLPVLLRGLQEAYLGGSLLFDEMESTQILQQHFREVRERQIDAMRAPGRAFLNELRGLPNIHSTSEGVLYEVLVDADGRKPKSTDEVRVHYAGYLIDGTKFDSSYDRGEPVDLSLDRVIQGWTIVVPLMSVGAKYKLYIPYELAYGERGSGKIPPYSTLIFEIELLEILTEDGEA